MGLFDLFSGGSREERERKRIRDLSKKAQEKYGDPASRTRALEQLRDIGGPEAITALLQRFTVKTEPGITDAEEREFALSLITSFGDDAIEPIVSFIRQSDTVAWPVRALESLVDGETLIGTLCDVLDKLAGEYVRDPDKKVVLIDRLAESRDPRIAPTAARFLDDASDEVRVAALRALVTQQDASQGAAVVDCLLGAEAPRVRASAAETLAELGIPLGDRRDQLLGKLPAGFHIDDSGKVARNA